MGIPPPAVMEKVLAFVVVVSFLALCYAQDAEQDPSKWKCPKKFSMMEYMRPLHCRKEKPYCPKGLICCPCPETQKKYCIRPRADDGSVDTKDDETFWQAMKEEFMQSHKKEHNECDDDDDDDDDHHTGEKDDKVFELDRMGDREEGHGHKKHHVRCHHRHMHKVVKIVVPIVALVVIVSIVVAVFCCIRRKRMRRAEVTKNSPYTPGNIAPVPEKGSMKGFLGLDFSPEVFVSSQSSYKRLEEEKERI